jgi:hypothetical protein
MRLLTLLLLVISSCGTVATVLSHVSPRGHRVVTPAVAATSGPRARGQADLTPLPNQAAVVTAFARGTLAPRVLVVESALALANHHVGAHLAGREDDGTVARALTQQALILTGASADLSGLPPPRLDALATVQLQCALEDLALVSDQLAGLLGETATVLQTAPSLEAGGAVIAVEATRSVAYAPRAHSALTILRRAEAWLETVDHETGAHGTLPGFAPGAPPIETQLGLP